jgi:hypothetical protein
MSLQPVTDDAPGTVLFPEYGELYELIAREVSRVGYWVVDGWDRSEPS